VIFDKAGALTILYANPKYDISDEVLDNLGTSTTGRKGKSTPSATSIKTSGTNDNTTGTGSKTDSNTPPPPGQNNNTLTRPGKK
jgi:hypothetical protein